MAYLNDQLAQRWSTDPVWIEEECPYSWREAGIMFMRAESEAQARQAAGKTATGAAAPGEPGAESVASIRARKLREAQDAADGIGDF